jgi:hypothetical protein
MRSLVRTQDGPPRNDGDVKTLAPFALILALQAQTPTPAPGPWLPRPVIIVDPRPYLNSPRPSHHATPHPKHRATPHPHATPAHRRPATTQTPETFDRLDTSPSPSPPHESVS